jgi:hypothetical protein
MLSPFKRVSLAKSPNSAYKAQHRIRPRALRCLDLLRRNARLTPWKRRWQSRRRRMSRANGASVEGMRLIPKTQYLRKTLRAA